MMTHLKKNLEIAVIVSEQICTDRSAQATTVLVTCKEASMYAIIHELLWVDLTNRISTF